MCMNKCSVSDLCHLSGSRGVGQGVMIGRLRYTSSQVRRMMCVCVYIMFVCMCEYVCMRVYITHIYV